MLKNEKKSKGVSMGSSSQSKSAMNDETNYRRQYHLFMQDFNDLVMDAEAKKKKLDEELHRRNILYAEVSFLRRRYEELIHIQSTKISMVKQEVARNQVPKIRRQAQAKRNASAVIDLNQISNEVEEEQRELQTFSETPRVESYPPKYSSNGRGEEQWQSDLNKSFCRNSGSGSSRSGKRKISWQDQLVLRA